MERKSVGIRFLALLLDNILFFLVFILITLVKGPTLGGCHSASYMGVNITVNTVEKFYGLCGLDALLFFIAFLAYFVIMEGLVGATLGKLALGIRVVTETGEKAGLPKALVRNLLRFVDSLPYCIPYLLGAILVWADSSGRQRLGDKAAGTFVVSARD